MADQLPIAADEVARKEFSTSFRGFDQYEVRAFLGRVAAELAGVLERERLLRDRLAAAEARAVPRELDEAQLDAALGQEAGKVLQAAHAAAAEIRSRAEEQVARLVREATDDAARIRAEAEGLLGRRTDEAEQAAAALLADAEVRATALLEEAQSRGREMVGEAQVVRERVLKDLARRRRVAHQQLEQLRAGRERLLEAYRVVRGTLDEATGELAVAEAEARAAAEAAALRTADEEEPDVAELEAEVAVGRQAGLTLVASPTDPDTTAGTPTVDAGPEAEPELDQRADDTGAVAPGADGAGEAPDAVVAGEAARGPVVTPQPVPVEERRTSALRILRRRAEPPVRPPDVIVPDDELEGVRIIPASAAPEPARAAPAPSPSATDTGVGPPPTATGEVALGPADTGEVAPPTGEPGAPAGVDQLFARLRADRAAAVARAEAVLDDDVAPEGSGPTDGRPEAGAVAEPEPGGDGEGGPVAPEVAAVDVGEGEGALPDVDEAALHERDGDVEGLERSLTRALKRALADEQNEVLDTLRRLRAAPTLDVVLPDADAHAARYAAAATPILHDAAHAGAKAFDVDAPDVAELAAALGAEVAADLRQRLARALDDAGDDDATLTDAVSAGYREWKRARAEALARHHVLAAHAAGRFAGMPEGELRWVVDPDEGGCPDCDDNALAGPTPKGSSFPTGQPHPPAHAGCRCLVVTVSH